MSRNITHRLFSGSELPAYVEAIKAVGGDVAKKADLLVGAWKAEADMLGKAINMPKPDDVQSMLMPIGEKMGAVSAISESAAPIAHLRNTLWL